MRATTANPPMERARRRLLESCAIAAGLVAFAHGGPALAQVSGSPVFVNVGAGTNVNNNGATNSTTVTVTQAQSIINWVPDDNAAAGAPIDFLAAGETWNFVGTGDYTVLNRFVNGSGGSLSRQIALNGTVNSFVGSTAGPQGGHIWFYNAGGVLVGNGAAINVGSLLLTANDIDTTGGLFGAGGEIRFRGAAGTSAITIADGAAINAAMGGNPGGSYVALVAPRIVQSGTVRVDGSAAYVAAEQADIRINNGLFDINVLVGAAGGNAIVHDGTTTGPSHEQDDIDQSRIYMVAIPKNDAVTMLVSGEVGYDDAVVAQVDPDGAVVLSAGYNIIGGQIAPEPANGTAADISIADTLFRSSVTAHASGDLVAGPTETVPAVPIPGAPQLGRLSVEGSATFAGDASATLIVGAGQQADVSGALSIASGGGNEGPGQIAVEIAGGQLTTGGDLALAATGPVATDGSSVGGDVSLTISDGGIVQAVNVVLDSTGAGGIGLAGEGGDGSGGSVTLLVSGSGSSLTSDGIALQSLGIGGGLIFSNGSATGASDTGGNGTGGNAALTVENGASLIANGTLSVGSTGYGQTGAVQSGSGTGGTAILTVAGSATSFSAATTSVSADGFGGGDYAQAPMPDVLAASGGDGVGGTASMLLSGDPESLVALGGASVSASGQGGSASAGEGSIGGDARGGTASMAVDGEVIVTSDGLSLLAAAGSGGATSPSTLTAKSGDARGGTVTLSATNDAIFTTGNGVDLSADGIAALSESVGTGAGGDVVVSAASGGSILVQANLSASAYGGSDGPDAVVDTGTGTGGNITLRADGGTLSANYFSLFADGTTVNAQGNGGTAQGGTLDLLASNGGLIEAYDPGSFSDLSASGWSGASDAGVDATGGSIRLVADGGSISLPGFAFVAANGVAGGRLIGGGTAPTGRGGTILLRTVAEPTNASSIALGNLAANADGSSYVSSEGPSDLTATGNGLGGDVSVDLEGGSITAGGTLALAANGYGGGVSAASGVGTGGTASFAQTGGTITAGDLLISADGYGGFDPVVPGQAVGGTATMTLSGGALTAANLTVSARGHGLDANEGDNFDPLSIIAAGNGGDGIGGSATIIIDGSATIDTGALAALATGSGGNGGDFYDYGGPPGAGGAAGNGTGGTATVNMLAGTLTTTSLLVDSSGVGGRGGSVFESSSSGTITGVGVGGVGGGGLGGLSTLNLSAGIDPAATVIVASRGIGGNGGDGTTGGSAGSAAGGTAQVVVTNYDAGLLNATVDASADGGVGGYGDDGTGGDGGDGDGGVARVAVDGPNASVSVTRANFVVGGHGGDGGASHSYAASAMAAGPAGGDGGAGTGGTIELVATANGALTLAAEPSTPGVIALDPAGTGGDGGAGADNGFAAGLVGGAGGNGGSARGGTVHMLANGGSIATDGVPVDISVGGIAGAAGVGGTGSGANGSDGAAGTTGGGRVIIESRFAAAGSNALIDLGDTSIAADGDAAGRIEFLGDGTITMSGLAAQALGMAAATNNDTDTAAAGIFFGIDGGAVRIAGPAVLVTDGSIGVYGQGSGTLDIGGDLGIRAADQIDIRHDLRQGTMPTIQAGGDIVMIAGTSISGAPGSEIAAGGTLGLTASAGTIGVDRLAGDTITLTSAGATHVEHAEATQGLIARASSFSTGLNSIITGGNIDIDAPGAVDLGNSSAGGFVFVVGQTISFNAIDAGASVALNANGVGATDGIDGGDISAAGDVVLSGNHVVIAGTIATPASLAISTGNGDAAAGLADVGGNISVVAAGNITGVYRAGGNVVLNADGDIAAEADAAGGYVDPNGIVSEGYVFADADGDAALTGSSAATMLAVRAGTAASIDGGQAGEDIFVLAGTTANLANLVAGDDIAVTSTGAMTIVNAATTGTGNDARSVVYGPGASQPLPFLQIQASPADLSNIVLGAPSATIDAADLSAFDNLTATAGGAVTATGLLQSGLATDISGASLSFAAVSAGTDLDLVATSGGIASTGTLAAGQNVVLDAATGIDADAIDSQGTTSLASANGPVAVGTLASGGSVSASGNSIAIGGSGGLDFASLVAATGDAVVGTDGTLSLADADVAGLADLSGDQGLIVAALTAGSAQLGSANGDIALTDASAAGDLSADAAGSIAVNGNVTGTSIALASGDIAIGAAGQLGTAGTTASLSLSNNSGLQTFIGGDGSGDGYNIDAAEMARLYGTQIRIVAPVATSVAGGTAGGRPIPDAVIGDFTMTGGTPTSNLGANGALTIETAGRAQVSGNVALTGLSDANGLVLLAGAALEVVLGEGTIRLSGATADVPGGRLSMRADQILVATRAAMNDIDNAASTDDIGVRLAQNDGITSDEGALFARGIDASVTEGFYVQNSGAGTDFAQRRGLTFGAGGLNVNTGGPATRLVLNGVQLGPQGQIVGLDTVPLLTVNGALPTRAGLDARSTMNGCLVLNPTICGAPPPRYDTQFPVQDVIEEEVDKDGDPGDGTALPTALITMRDLDPMTGAPLLDDPVTGAGNDDLWTAPEGDPANE